MHSFLDPKLKNFDPASKSAFGSKHSYQLAEETRYNVINGQLLTSGSGKMATPTEKCTHIAFSKMNGSNICSVILTYNVQYSFVMSCQVDNN